MLQPLRIRFEPQLEDGYCLPACVRMVLAAQGLDVSQGRISHLLATTEAGTPFSRLHRLSSLGVPVQIGVDGTLQQLLTTIATNVPVIAAVHAGWLPYARIESPHAVVVAGASTAALTIFDPATANGPVDVPFDAWLAAWTEMDLGYAIIRR